MVVLYLLGAILLFGIVALSFIGFVHHDAPGATSQETDRILAAAVPYSGRKLAGWSLFLGGLICAGFPLLFSVTPGQASATAREARARLAREFTGPTVELRAYSVHTFSARELSEFLRNVPFWPMGLVSIRALDHSDPVTILAPVRELQQIVEKLGDGPFAVKGCGSPPCHEYLAPGALEQLDSVAADPSGYLKLHQVLMLWLGIFFDLLVIYPSFAIFVLSRADQETRARELLKALLVEGKIRGREAKLEMASLWTRVVTLGVIRYCARSPAGDLRWVSYRPLPGADVGTAGVLVALHDPAGGSAGYAFLPNLALSRSIEPDTAPKAAA